MTAHDTVPQIAALDLPAAAIMEAAR